MSYGAGAPGVAGTATTRASSGLLLGRALVDGIFGDTCVGCRERPAGRRLALCPRCHGRLEAHHPIGGCRCRSCARPLVGATGRTVRCGTCLADPPPWRRLYTFWSYRAPFDAVIHAFKFQGLEQLGAELAATAFDEIAEDLLAGDDGLGIDAVVPVPLPWPRRLRRGFNQAEAIAAPLAARLGLPLRHALRRRPSPPQSLLSRRQRTGNLRRSLLARERLAGARVLLVDDVVTTGATLRAATATLLHAGAASVSALAIAWTPPAGREENPPHRGFQGGECVYNALR